MTAQPETALFEPPYPAGPARRGGVGAGPGTAEVRFPYDGSLVASAPVGDVALAQRALDEAVAVRERGRAPALARPPGRAAGAHAALAERRAEVEQLLVLETGKPLVDCRVEVDRTLLTLLDRGRGGGPAPRRDRAARPAAQRGGPARLLGAQADRRGGRHRRLQLPAAARRPQDRPGPRGRVPGHRQARAADAAGDPVAGPRWCARRSRRPGARAPRSSWSPAAWTSARR